MKRRPTQAPDLGPALTLAIDVTALIGAFLDIVEQELRAIQTRNRKPETANRNRKPKPKTENGNRT